MNIALLKFLFLRNSEIFFYLTICFKWQNKKFRSITIGWIIFIWIYKTVYPATCCCGSVWLNGKEGKEKAHVSNMFNFTMLVGIQYSLLFHCLRGMMTLLINFFYCKPLAVAKLWLVDISQHDNWNADFQLRWHTCRSSEFKNSVV